MKYLKKYNENLKDLKESSMDNIKLSIYTPILSMIGEYGILDDENDELRSLFALEDDLSKIFLLKTNIKYKFDIQDASDDKGKKLSFLVIVDSKNTEFELVDSDVSNLETLYDLFVLINSKLEKSSFIDNRQVYFRGKLTSIDDPLMGDINPTEKYWED
jgi:hypothetical protein